MRTGDQQRYGEAFLFEAFADRLALLVPGVDALQHDGQLEVAERHVVPDPGHVPPGEPGVLGRELRSRPEPGAGGGVGGDAASPLVVPAVAVPAVAVPAVAVPAVAVPAGGEPAFLALFGPVDEGQAQVGQRVAQ